MAEKTFKPMLAKDMVPEKLKFPVAVQAKIDGIRCIVKDGKALSRTMKEIPNREIFNALSKPEFEGLDGEIVVGSPTAEDCYRKTASYVMAPNKVGEFWTFYIFDRHNHPGTYSERAGTLIDGSLFTPHTAVLLASTVDTMDQLRHEEELHVKAGYEGVIVRGPDTFYKYGRSSPTKGELLKVKLYQDSEAEIIGVEEELHNGNEAEKDAFGRTKRSSVKANKTGKGTLGALIVRDLVSGVEFKVGTGFNASQRKELWKSHADGDLVGSTIKYKFFAVGVKDKPRHPVFLGFRNMEIDG